LQKLDGFNQKRRENAARLTDGLLGLRGLVIPSTRARSKHVFHQYTVRITPEFPVSRDELRDTLAAQGIQTGVYYPVPLHRQPCYAQLGHSTSLPVSERLAESVLSLPVHPGLATDDLDRIVDGIRNC